MNHSRETNERARCSWYWVVALLLVFPVSAGAQTWTWSSEPVDVGGIYSSLAVDSNGNVHVAYVSNEDSIKYAFRQTGSGKWYSMFVDDLQGSAAAIATTSIALDPDQNPHICYTRGQIRYANWDGKKWHTQQLNPGAGQVSYTCSVAVATDGTPHVTWYQYGAPDGSDYLHIKHATLQSGVWVARTLDLEPQTGKWQSIALDGGGNPHVSYDSFASGALKYAFWDGKNWNLQVVDRRTAKRGISTLGMGNYLVLDRDGKAGISYYDDSSLMYAWQQDKGWKIDTISDIASFGSWIGYHSSQVLDAEGHPHIAYDNAGELEHAWWDGRDWHIQTIVPWGLEQYRASSIGIDKDQTLYISYRDPNDGSLKVAIGRMTPASQTLSKVNK
jgi:hypothetical protein